MRWAMSAIASFSQRRVEGFYHISLLSLRPLNHRPLEGRQSSPSFIRPRDDHNAEIVLPSVAPFTRDDHNAEISAPPRSLHSKGLLLSQWRQRIRRRSLISMVDAI